jgi:hypothetical protein
MAPLRSVARAIRDSGAAWILPCDDRAVWHLHELHAAAVGGDPEYAPLVDVIERSIGDPASYPVVASRARLLRAAEAAGVLIPTTTAVTSMEHLVAETGGRRFPLVMKVDGSWGGLGVKVVSSVEEAKACYARMVEPLGLLPMLKRVVVNRDPFWIESWRRQAAPGVLVQSYVEGVPANCVIFCKEGRVLAAIAVEVAAAQSTLGPATKVRLIEGGAMLRASEALAAGLQLSGVHGLDFMLDSESGAAYLIELNARCAMPCHLRAGGGGDLVGALSAELLGGLLGELPRLQTSLAPGDGVAYFPQAWLADPKDPSLRTGFHDVPWSEPELVKELLLLPWPDRSFLARLSDRLRGLSFDDRSSRAVTFAPGVLEEPVSLLLHDNRLEEKIL